MKLIRHPSLGPRPAEEFFYGGAVRPMPDAGAASDAEWADYVHNRAAAAGVKQEWWYHTPSGTWFTAERDTRTDTFVAPAEGSADA